MMHPTWQRSRSRGATMKSASDKSTARSDRTSNNVSDTSSEGYSHRDTSRKISAFATTCVALVTRLSTADRCVIPNLLLGAISMPAAFWGRLNHAKPFTLARELTARTATPRSQLATHTHVLGTMLVPLLHAAQIVAVWYLRARCRLHVKQAVTDLHVSVSPCETRTIGAARNHPATSAASHDWRKKSAHEIPVPRIPAFTSARILQGLDLQPVHWQSN